MGLLSLALFSYLARIFMAGDAVVDVRDNDRVDAVHDGTDVAAKYLLLALLAWTFGRQPLPRCLTKPCMPSACHHCDQRLRTAGPPPAHEPPTSSACRYTIAGAFSVIGELLFAVIALYDLLIFGTVVSSYAVLSFLCLCRYCP